MSGKTGGALPGTMRAAVYRGPREVVVEDRPVPELGPHDVLLEVSHCGVCGSDLHMFVDGWGAPDSIGGHEYSGRVVAVGADVTGWSSGDEVVGGPAQRCGTCEYCRAGRPQLCTGRSNPGVGEFQGAFADFVRVHEAELLRVPPGVSMRAAALAEPLAVALHGLTRGGVEAGQRVLVTGCGPIGALSIAAARARGVTDIVASEPHPTRRALAEKLGATVVTPDDLPKPSMPFDLVDDPFDVALECSGHGVAMETALAQLKRGGTLVLVGAGMSWPRFDNNRILLNELVITGAFVYDPDGFPRALELLGAPDFPTDVLIESDDVPLEGLYDAVERLVAGELPAKVLIAPGARGTEDWKRRRPMTTTPTRTPRFNHVAMSVPSELLGEDGRRDLVRFYDEVFGWKELPTETVDGKKLVLSAYTYEQFVFLIADDPPMACPRLDHFGMSVETEQELDDMLARAKAFRTHDDRVDIVDREVTDHGILAITSFYVRYLLPMMVEIQWWDFKKRDEPA